MGPLNVASQSFSGSPQSLEDLIGEYNRHSAQLDSLSKTLVYVGSGTFSLSWNGTGSGTTQTFQANNTHNLGYAPGFVAFYNFKGETKWYPCDDYRYDNTGQPLFGMSVGSDTTTIYSQLTSYPAAPAVAVTVNFTWYLLTQPAQATL